MPKKLERYIEQAIRDGMFHAWNDRVNIDGDPKSSQAWIEFISKYKEWIKDKALYTAADFLLHEKQDSCYQDQKALHDLLEEEND
jgi:hypothetical protein